MKSWTQGLTQFDVTNYTMTEAKGVFDYYMKGNVLFDGIFFPFTFQWLHRAVVCWMASH